MDAEAKSKSTNRQLAGLLGPEKGDRENDKLRKELRKQQDIKYELPRRIEIGRPTKPAPPKTTVGMPWNGRPPQWAKLLEHSKKRYRV